MKLKPILFTTLLCGLAGFGSAHGAVVNYTAFGPAGVTVSVSDEKQFFTLTHDLFVKDVTNNHQITIGSGSLIHSHFIEAQGNGVKTVSVQFSDPVLGFIYNEGTWGGHGLRGSHFLSDKPSDFQYFGLSRNGGDAVFANKDLMSGFFTLTGGTDHVRVITSATPAPVPVPAAVWLFGSGLMLFPFLGKLRRRKEIEATAA